MHCTISAATSVVLKEWQNTSFMSGVSFFKIATNFCVCDVLANKSMEKKFSSAQRLYYLNTPIYFIFFERGILFNLESKNGKNDQNHPCCRVRRNLQPHWKSCQMGSNPMRMMEFFQYICLPIKYQSLSDQHDLLVWWKFCTISTTWAVPIIVESPEWAHKIANSTRSGENQTGEDPVPLGNQMGDQWGRLKCSLRRQSMSTFSWNCSCKVIVSSLMMCLVGWIVGLPYLAIFFFLILKNLVFLLVEAHKKYIYTFWSSLMHFISYYTRFHFLFLIIYYDEWNFFC